MLFVKILFPNHQEYQLDKQSAIGSREKNRGVQESELPGSFWGTGCILDGQRAGMLFQQTVSGTGSSLEELKENAKFQDVGILQDYMTVMSHTMSGEDYAKLEKDGFHFEQLEPEEAVTILDKIKAQLIQAGEYIEGYTDQVDEAVLAEALGSATLARELSENMKNADIPVYDETVAEICRAWDMAAQLQTPLDATYAYLMEQGLEPRIENLYLAQNCGNGEERNSQPMYYKEEVQGYYAPEASGQGAFSENSERFLEQAEHIMDELGVDGEEQRKEALWLLQNHMEPSYENLERLKNLKSVSFPVTEETFAKAVTNALLMGEKPVYADLSLPENLYEKASRMLIKYREVEEARLHMSAEVNVRLLRSGFSIDTASMEEVVEGLKQAEQELANRYFPGVSDAVDRYRLYRNTDSIIQELPLLPAKNIAMLSGNGLQTVGLSDFYEKASGERERLLAASKEYELLGTSPRADLGDSIRKAFGNVEQLLSQLHIEANEENCRAVRILGYNQMEITAETIAEIREADASVQQVIGKMTPAAVLRMIRDGVNPLEHSFEQLNDYFDGLPAEYEEEAVKYSKFLYGLEQRKEITGEERDSFIGVYRLLRQIEKTDGAAIGALVNTGAELHFRNLLSAVRTGKVKAVDVRLDRYAGVLEELVAKGDNISDQISRAFLSDTREIMEKITDEETERDFLWEQQRQNREAGLEVDSESAKLVQKAELPLNLENLLAAQNLRKKGTNPFLPENSRNETLEELFTEAEDAQGFTRAYQQELDGYQKDLEQLTMEADSVVDVKRFRLMHKQISVMSALAEKQEYDIPMYLGGELTRVHLTLEREKENAGQVALIVTMPGKNGQDESLEANFSVSGERLSGYYVTNQPDMVMKLKQGTDIFRELIKEETSWSMDADLPILDQSAGDKAGQKAGGRNRTTVKERLSAPVAETLQNNKISDAELFRIARLFLRAMKDTAPSERGVYEN